jgi:hypothetical protein
MEIDLISENKDATKIFFFYFLDVFIIIPLYK